MLIRGYFRVRAIRGPSADSRPRPGSRHSVGLTLALLALRRQAIGLGDRPGLALPDLLGGVRGDVGQLDLIVLATRRGEQRDGEGQARREGARGAR